MSRKKTLTSEWTDSARSPEPEPETGSESESFQYGRVLVLSLFENKDDDVTVTYELSASSPANTAVSPTWPPPAQEGADDKQETKEETNPKTFKYENYWTCDFILFMSHIHVNSR